MKQKLSCIVFLALVMLVISISPIYAGNWKKDNKGWWYQENDGTYPKDDYKYVNEQWYYFDQEGYMVIGWYQIDGYWHYFQADGSELGEGWHWINGNCYYMDANGDMLTDTWIGDSYVDASGVWVKGKVKEVVGWNKSGNRWWYKFEDGSFAKSGWFNIDDTSYLFDDAGYMLTGWQKYEDDWYLLSDSGNPLTGWQQRNGKWYLLDDSGCMLTGWQCQENKWYLLDDSGNPLTGWQNQDGDWYLLSSSGYMLTGWQKQSGKWYYLDENDNYGVMCIGEVNIDEKTYYFNQDGTMYTGWLKEINKWADTNEDCIDWKYFNQDGSMQIGWLTLNGKKYHFSDSGYLKCSYPSRGDTIVIREIDGQGYYGFDQNGCMVLGWQVYHDKFKDVINISIDYPGDISKNFIVNNGNNDFVVNGPGNSIVRSSFISYINGAYVHQDNKTAEYRNITTVNWSKNQISLSQGYENGHYINSGYDGFLTFTFITNKINNSVLRYWVDEKIKHIVMVI